MLSDLESSYFKTSSIMHGHLLRGNANRVWNCLTYIFIGKQRVFQNNDVTGIGPKLTIKGKRG